MKGAQKNIHSRIAMHACPKFQSFWDVQHWLVPKRRRMVFNFWHFLPKLGHLVLKWKQLLVCKKDCIWLIYELWWQIGSSRCQISKTTAKGLSFQKNLHKLHHLFFKWKELLVFKKKRSVFEDVGDKLALAGGKYQK